jgi:hypothetical protein
MKGSENDVIFLSVEKQCHATKHLQVKSPVENKIHQMYNESSDNFSIWSKNRQHCS